MSHSEKKDLPWECMDNHVPDWLLKNHSELHACMSEEDINRSYMILVRYNNLTDIEESDEEDAFSLYGVETEKQELVEEYIKLHEKYRKEAEELDDEYTKNK